MEERYEEAIRLFLETGRPLTKIAKDLSDENFKLCRQKLGRIIRERYKINIKSYSHKKLLERYESVYQEFTSSDEPMKSICKRYGISQAHFSRFIEERDSLYEDSVVQKAKYKVNQNAFSTIDTEEKAYWLGFLFADGYNSGTYIQLTIAAQDVNHLRKYRKFLSSNHPIRYRPVDNTVNITISDPKISNDLSSAGCIKGKTYYSTFPGPATLKRTLLRHFIRGYFDGDGYIGKIIRQDITSVNSLQRKIKKITITVKSENIAEQLAELIRKCTGVKCSIYYYEPHDKYEVYLEGQSNVKRFLDILYQEATVYLDRKYAQYLEYILPSDLETDQIISAKLSGNILPGLEHDMAIGQPEPKAC